MKHNRALYSLSVDDQLEFFFRSFAWACDLQAADRNRYISNIGKQQDALTPHDRSFRVRGSLPGKRYR